jgi:mycothiol synthase
VRSSLDDLPAVDLPSDIVTRPYRMEADDASVNAAINESFRDHWGHTDNPLDQWRHFVSSPMFQPELTIVAQDARSGEVAGTCIILINDEENARLSVKRGWIEILGVLRPFRQYGLGTALLVAGMHNLRDAGMRQAVLAADSENLTGATRLYERVGFVVAKTRVAYRKRMRGA